MKKKYLKSNFLSVPTYDFSDIASFDRAIDAAIFNVAQAAHELEHLQKIKNIRSHEKTSLSKT